MVGSHWSDRSQEKQSPPMVLRLPTISIVELKSDRRLMFTHVTRVYRGKLYSLGKVRFGKCFSPLSSRSALNVAPGPASGQINIPCSAGYRLHPLRMQPRFRYVTRYRNHPGNRNSTLSSIRALRKRHLFKKTVWITERLTEARNWNFFDDPVSLTPRS